jgi:hypothetical protein
MPASRKYDREWTAFGLWVQGHSANSKDPVTVADVQRKTGLAYSTLMRAQYQRVTRSVARAISRAIGGAVAIDDIAKPQRKRGKQVQP